MLYSVQEILHVEPYRIILLFNTFEVREIDLEEKIKRKSTSPESVYRKLLDKECFTSVKHDGYTIYWENLITMYNLDGTPEPANLDFCPDVLYNESKPVSEYVYDITEKTIHVIESTEV
jgi:hypothetical protein